MSTFEGRIPEFPGIMIDRFEADPTIKAYFLSHDHADHRVGILEHDVISHVVNNGIKIYASPLTVRMLRNRQDFRRLHDSFQALELDIPHKILIDCGGVGYPVIVTLTSANHIVGSVMFLLEKEKPSFRCLYTGDFRLTKQDLKLKRCFKLPKGVKVFNAIYFDSTWCSPGNNWNIPTREDTLRDIEPLVDRHLQANESNYLCIFTMYDVGYENLLQELAKLAGSRIHVTNERLSLYSGFPGITDILTTDPENCRVHFCQKGFPSKSKCCSKVREDFRSGRIMKLMFSYKKFIEEHRENQEQELYVKNKRHKDLYHVCWSTHPSLEEVSDLLNYLSPDSVHANVIHDCTEEEILANLERGSISRKKWHVSKPEAGQGTSAKRKHTTESSSQSSAQSDDSPSDGLITRLRLKGYMEKRQASPSPSLALLEDSRLKEIL